MADDVHGQFIGLQQNRQYDVSYRQGIGRNLSSADSTSTNRRGNALFLLRKSIWEMMAVQGTPVLVIESVWRWAIDIL